MRSAPLRNHEENYEFFYELLKKHIEILSKETKKKPSEIKKVLGDAVIMTAEKAKSFGIVHEIIQKLPLTKQTP